VLKEAMAETATINFYLQPGARRTGVKGMHGDRIKIAVAAPPLDGRANEALVEYLAEALSISKSAIEIIAGKTSRLKRVSITGMRAEEVKNRLLSLAV